MSTDLSYATTKELLDELSRRSDAVIFGFLPKGNKESQYFVGHYGNILIGLGLMDALTMQLHVIVEARQKGRAVSDDEQSTQGEEDK